MLGLVALSLLLGPHQCGCDNEFDYVAIVEVAVLFIGIFVCMQPALQILRLRGAELGLDTPAKFFWASGWLSSVLDNAPTYLVFFEAAKSLGGGQRGHRRAWSRAAAGGHQPGLGLHGGDDLYRQRAEFHGQRSPKRPA